MRTFRPTQIGILGWLAAALLMASAATVKGDDFTYTTNYPATNTITITGYTGPGGSVTIPGTINGLPVTCIGHGTFANCNCLTNVTIPNSVTSIGNSAFTSCGSLTNIIIPDSVISIGNEAFEYCGVTSVTIGNSVASIGGAAFNWCTSLTSVYFKGNAPGIGSFVFYRSGKTTIYHLPGTAGWGATFGGFPTMLWKP